MPVKKNSESQSVGSTSDYAARIRTLIEKDRVVQARALTSEALEANPEDPDILRLHEVLKPPRGKPRRITDADRSEEFQWMIANRDAYRGRWVAVDGNRLVADARSFWGAPEPYQESQERSRSTCPSPNRAQPSGSIRCTRQERFVHRRRDTLDKNPRTATSVASARSIRRVWSKR